MKTTMKIYTHVTNKMKKDASTYNSHLNDRLVNFNPNLSDIHTLKENSNIQIETWGYKSMKFSDFETDEKKSDKYIPKIAILDSGISTDHQELKGVIRGEYNAIDPNSSVKDDLGHGTAIAGIIASLDNTEGIVGTSHGMDLYSVKILDSNGEGSVDSLIRGIEWCIDNKIDVINVSFGMSSDNPKLKKAIDKAIKANMIIVAAAGNNTRLMVDYPAKYEGVISINAVNKQYKTEKLYSSRGKIDFCAPGINILTLSNKGNYKEFSGTSFAAAFVSGFVVNLLNAPSKYGIDLNDKYSTIYSYLKEHAVNLGEKDLYGNGFIQYQ
ncbi:Subtilase family protein [Virgibacillus pantothenticus]|nr:Subtilase family protein [Virgibacillus pantothenticus]